MENKAIPDLLKQQKIIIKNLTRLSKHFDEAKHELECYGDSCEVHYGHVGDATQINCLIQEVVDRVFQEGEYV